MLPLLRVFLALVLLGASAPLKAHVVEQFYIKVLTSDVGWQLEVFFDVGYANPEWRGDPDSPQPTRDWLLERTTAEHEILRAETETYLRDCMGFNGPEEPQEVDGPDNERVIRS